MNIGAPLREHFPDCPEQVDDVSSCDWCRWAGSSPAIESLTAVITDSRHLRASEGFASVAGVVAIRRLDDLLEEWSPDGTPNNSAAALARDLRVEAHSELSRLHNELERLMSPQGTVQRAALDTAAIVATIALQDPRWGHLRDDLPAELTSRIVALGGQTSAETQLSMVAAGIHNRHCPELPRLTSQPEWERCRRGRRRADALPDDGSLEALVLESLWAEHHTELRAIAGEIAALTPSATVTLQRPGSPHPNSRTRSLVWRLNTIDWHATLADTGWVEVPWYVEVAIDFAAANGQMSALSLT